MILIVGLGNPGEKYKNSRHNMGFVVLDALLQFAAQSIGQVQNKGSQLTDVEWKLEKSMQAEVARSGSLVLVKPQTYMNLSGQAVQKAFKKYDYAALGKKDFSNLFVVYDDLDLPVGKYKLVFGSGPKVHNGLNSIEDALGTDQFWHIRIGVDGRNGDRSIPPEDYVLSGFTQDEQVLLKKVVDSAVEMLSVRLTS